MIEHLLTVQHPELLTQVLTVLATHGWDRDGDDSFADVAVTK